MSIFHFKALMLSAFAWGWFEVVALPKPMLIFFLFLAIIIDLITGLIKSWGQGQVTTSAGFRKTVSKLLTYVAVIIGVWILANLISMGYNTGLDYVILVDGSIGFLTFIETYSIFENIYEASPNSLLSKKFIKPILKFLKGKINSHPIDDIIKNSEDATDEEK